MRLGPSSAYLLAVQEMKVPGVPLVTGDEEVLLVCYLKCYTQDVPGVFFDLIRLSCTHQSSKCAQMHWRALRQAFKTSCYHLDPKAEKRELLRQYSPLQTIHNVHLNKH